MATRKSEKEVNGSTILQTEEAQSAPLTCGIIMPISAIDGCTAEHWSDVKGIIFESVEAIASPKFSAKLVSDADDVGVIQKRIVQSIYTSDVVVCDVSGKNPNVMFELGLRLAFDKPTVIIKDDKTDYSFDTGIIEHVSYPRDLRFNKMIAFKTLLVDKVTATYKASIENPEHSTFLKNFGKFHVASLSQDVVSADAIVVEMLSDIQSELSRMRNAIPRELRRARSEKGVDATIRIASEVAKYLAEHPKSDVRDLIRDAKFRHEMEMECEAPKYFDGPTEFEEALGRVLKEMAVSKARSA